MSSAGQSWHQENQRRLAVELDALRRFVEHRLNAEPGGELPDGAGPVTAEPAPALVSPLDRIAHVFGLTPFERAVLLLCAGVELDAALSALMARAHQDPRRTLPTFSIALALLPGAHWSALCHAAPLRYWRLVRLTAGESLTTSPLRIDERVLHHLVGLDD